MGGTELLGQLNACEVSVSLDRDELVLRPGSRVPPDLLAEVREPIRDGLKSFIEPHSTPWAAGVKRNSRLTSTINPCTGGNSRSARH